jgi:hypothetical protein
MTTSTPEPFGKRAIVLDAKLTDFILSNDHKIGSLKARFFKSALDIGHNQAYILKANLLRAAANETPSFLRAEPHGSHYALVSRLSFGEKSAFVRSLWLVKSGDEAPSLVSAFVVTENQTHFEDCCHD